MLLTLVMEPQTDNLRSPCPRGGSVFNHDVWRLQLHVLYVVYVHGEVLDSHLVQDHDRIVWWHTILREKTCSFTAAFLPFTPFEIVSHDMCRILNYLEDVGVGILQHNSAL